MGKACERRERRERRRDPNAHAKRKVRGGQGKEEETREKGIGGKGEGTGEGREEGAGEGGKKQQATPRSPVPLQNGPQTCMLTELVRNKTYRRNNCAKACRSLGSDIGR